MGGGGGGAGGAAGEGGGGGGGGSSGTNGTNGANGATNGVHELVVSNVLGAGPEAREGKRGLMARGMWRGRKRGAVQWTAAATAGGRGSVEIKPAIPQAQYAAQSILAACELPTPTPSGLGVAVSCGPAPL